MNNLLQSYLTRRNLPELEIMNKLTEAGLISDNCVMADSVEQFDALKACQWLERNLH